MLKDEQTGSAIFHITYVGEGVVRIPGAGVFQSGTAAYVDESIANLARGIDDFKVRGPIVQVADAPPAPAAKPVVAEAKPEPKPEPPKPADPPKAEAAPAKKDERETTQSKRKGPNKKDEKAAAPAASAESDDEAPAAEATK
jgi:hypothetical protein